MNRIVWLVSMYALIYTAGCSAKAKEKKAETGKFTVTTPFKADTTVTKEYVSQIQSVRNIEIRAQEKGYLQNINIDEGQYVHAGQVLFRIMPKLYEAEMLKAQAAMKEAELEMLNTKTLAEKNIVSKTEQSIAQAKLDEAKAELSLAQLHLSFTEIKAPFDGVVDRIRFKLGSLIDEGTLLTTLSDNKSMYVYFNVSESEYLDYKASKTNERNNVTLLLANGQTHKYKGTVETVEGEFDNETGNIAFRARFPNPDKLLKNGETGKVLMTVPLKNALIIPQKATYEIQDKLYVFVIDKNNVVKSRNITIAGRMPDLYVVNAGISDNDKIVLEGVQRVKENDKIKFEYLKPEEVVFNLRLKAE